VSGKAWIVQQIQWKYTDEWFVPEGDQPVKAFLSRERAEEERVRLDAEARREVLAGEWGIDDTSNLGMTFGLLPEMTSLPVDELERRLAALGLPPFPQDAYGNGSYPDHYNEKWWQDAWATVGEARADELWGLFDKLRFAEIVEVDLPPRFLARPRLYIREQMEERGLPVYFPFATRAEADAFAATAHPLEINPFLFAQDVIAGDLIFFPFDPNYEDDELPAAPLAELKSLAVSLGLPPADWIPGSGWSGSVWRDWWDRHEAALTDDQKRALWQFLIPAPFEIIPLPVEE
jgi:hypothetical protein